MQELFDIQKKDIKEIYNRIINLSHTVYNIRTELFYEINKCFMGCRGSAGNTDYIIDVINCIFYQIDFINEDLNDISKMLKENPDINFDSNIKNDGKLLSVYKETYAIRNKIDDIKMFMVSPGVFKDMPLFGFSCMSNEHFKKIDTIQILLDMIKKDLKAIQERL